jgi:phosphoserine phosphatase
MLLGVTMKMLKPVLLRTSWVVFVVLLGACSAHEPAPALDPLPSWSDGVVKQSILAFVQEITDPSSPDFVPADGRVAVFDNDGTLWSEKPTYTQLLFVLDRIQALAPEHPEWAEDPLFQAALAKDAAALVAAGKHGRMQLAEAALSGMTTAEFQSIVEAWIDTARHPVSGRPFTEMVFQPMLELMDFLRDSGIRVYVVSGTGLEFMRPWTYEIYGIPPENVIGTQQALRYERRHNGPVLVREGNLHFINNKEGKPIAIQRIIGRHPLIAVGNSDGDFEMLEWTTGGAGKRLGLIVHHTDAEREWAYDRESLEGRLNRAMDAAPKHGWLLIDMARDWRVVYPPTD